MLYSCNRCSVYIYTLYYSHINIYHYVRLYPLIIYSIYQYILYHSIVSHYIPLHVPYYLWFKILVFTRPPIPASSKPAPRNFWGPSCAVSAGFSSILGHPQRIYIYYIYIKGLCKSGNSKFHPMFQCFEQHLLDHVSIELKVKGQLDIMGQTQKPSGFKAGQRGYSSRRMYPNVWEYHQQKRGCLLKSKQSEVHSDFCRSESLLYGISTTLMKQVGQPIWVQRAFPPVVLFESWLCPMFFSWYHHVSWFNDHFLPGLHNPYGRPPPCAVSRIPQPRKMHWGYCLVNSGDAPKSTEKMMAWPTMMA